MSDPVDDLAAAHVEAHAALSPMWATVIGIPGHERELDDLSPDGVRASQELSRSTLRELERVAPGSDAPARQAVAAAFMRERLTTGIELTDSEWRRSLSSMGSPIHAVRLIFEQMPRSTAADLADIAARLAAVPQALGGYTATLEEGLAHGEVVARRQVLRVIGDCEAFLGLDGPARTGTPFTAALVEAAEGVAGAPAADLARAARLALDGFAAIRDFLADTYLPAATEREGVGAERYGRFAASFTGAQLDLAETEAWGWEEIARLRAEIDATVAQIDDRASYEEVVEHLETDPARTIDGPEAMIAWLQDLVDSTIDALHGRHFDIPERVRHLTVVPAPPGGPPVAYYTGPDESFTRPGRYWFPIGGRVSFPTWQEVSIAYHEGVPGHHLEIAMQRHQAASLNRMQTTTLVSGYSEGWALYAERLMDELGFLDDPAHRLGMLTAQLFRAVRVVVDIGLHTERTIPPAAGVVPGAGRTWTPEIARAWIAGLRFLPDEALDGEVARYLGLPGQAISYKVGERAWRAARQAAHDADPAAFDLTAFHAHALSLGVMGLDLLTEALPAAVVGRPLDVTDR